MPITTEQTECKCGKHHIKWVYVEDWGHCHLAKERCCADCAFATLKTAFKVVATIAAGPDRVIYRVYN